MKVKTIALCALAVLPLLLSACSSAGAVEVSCDDFMEQNHISRQVDVKAGDTFTVTLCSNATTGFQWGEAAQIGDGAVLRQMGHEFIAPEEEGGKEPVAGAAGQEKWTFEAVSKGTTRCPWITASPGTVARRAPGRSS